MVLPRYALSFPASVKSGKDSRKVPRKSIQYYLAMYPRINGQVSLLRFLASLPQSGEKSCGIGCSSVFVAQRSEIVQNSKNLSPVFSYRVRMAHPTNQGERFRKPKEKLYICTMNTQGLLALAQLILPSEILSNFEVVRVEEESSLIRIYLDESVRAEYKENPKIESKGFCDAVTIRDFPIRDKGVDLIVRRRKWYDRQNNRYFSDSYDLKAEGTRYSKEFAAFLKGVYGDDPYDLPFA